MTSAERIVGSYSEMFSPRLQKAHMALVTWAEETRSDRWPTPDDVCWFAKIYGVPRGELGGLVGMLSQQPFPHRRAVWVDAVRDPDAATPHKIRQHDEPVVKAFGWFCATTDLGWLRLPQPTLH